MEFKNYLNFPTRNINDIINFKKIPQKAKNNKEDFIIREKQTKNVTQQQY